MKQVKKVIVILGGWMIRDSNGQWRTINYDEKGDWFGVSGGRLRVIASVYLHNDDPESLIIASGGKGQLEKIPDAPTLASVIKKELVELDIPSEKIIEENKSGNTYQQLIALQKIIIEMKFKHIYFVSNAYHLPRIRAMLKYRLELRRLAQMPYLKLVSAEKIAIAHDSKKWRKMIKAAYASEEMQKRIALEKKGVREIKAGKYKFH